MSSSEKAKIALVLALLLLGVSGVASGLVIFGLYEGETQIRHAHDIQMSIANLQYSLSEVGAFGTSYVNTETPEILKSFWDRVGKVRVAMSRVRQLTARNPAQRVLCDHLESTVNRRLAAAMDAVELRRQNKFDPQQQLRLAFAVSQASFDSDVTERQMIQNEDVLLQQRSRSTDVLFVTLPIVFGVSLALSACMFWVYDRLLHRELWKHAGMETQLRDLSVELMRAQDQERRRLARELHDGLGQTLAGVKMMVEALAVGDPEDAQKTEISTLLGDAISQTRTIAHLFHPPHLDEFGFTASAKALIETFQENTGVNVDATLPPPTARLSPILELTLFRVLQETLNNIQRHSRSAKAKVSIERDAQWVTLRVRDYGHGIPPETLAAIRTGGKHPGMGLTGMIERIREQGGSLEVRSDESGTDIIAKVPNFARAKAPDSIAVPPPTPQKNKAQKKNAGWKRPSQPQFCA